MQSPRKLPVTIILWFLSVVCLADEGHHHHSHDSHKNIAKDQPVPSLRLHLYRDAVDGFNVYVDAQNFTFSLPVAKQDLLTSDLAELPLDSKLVSGHAHLYIDDQKIGRVYGRYLHLPGKYLKKGKHKIRINLNDDNHVAWAVNDKEIEATITLDLNSEQPIIAATSHFAVGQP